MRDRPFIVLYLLAATAGLFFASFSTFDFVQHLDRQVHSIHCSFVPGLAEPDLASSSGCQVTMMSPYSSLLRKHIWGGLPISLPAMAVFAFLLYRGIDVLGRQGRDRRAAAGFLAIASVIPVAASIVMGYIAMAKLDAACKLCIGIYVASAACLLFSLLAWRSASADEMLTSDAGQHEHQDGNGGLVAGVLQGVAFVVVPVLVYIAVMPNYSGYVGKCGSLTQPKDPYGVMASFGSATRGIPAIEVFDPLCPACKAFEARLEASGLDQKISRKALLFPLDDTCNWMVSSALHPGACTISEAVLCAGGKIDDVVKWAFDHQDAIREAAAKDPQAPARMVTTKFPELESCIGSAEVKSKLNKSLRWAVANHIPVLTPQLYLDGVKLCDEDTDLGLEYTLHRMLQAHAAGTLGKEGRSP